MKTAKQKTAAEVKPRARPRAKRIPSTGARFRISDELWALMERKRVTNHRVDSGAEGVVTCEPPRPGA